MIGIQISAERKSTFEYKYTALYGRNDSEFPVNGDKVPVVGRDNKSCDSLIEQIVRDIGNQRYRLIMGNGMSLEDGERIRKYITHLRKKS